MTLNIAKVKSIDRCPDRLKRNYPLKLKDLMPHATLEVKKLELVWDNAFLRHVLREGPW